MTAFDELLAGARSGDLPRMQRALESGADVNAAQAAVYDPQISCYTGNRTALMYAAWNGRPDALVFLIDRGASLDTRDGEGMSALHYAIEGKSSTAMRALVERGASLTVLSMGGSVLDAAIRLMPPADVEYLIGKGARARLP